MIQMVHEDVPNGEGGLFCPRVFCDYCRELIESAGEGIVGWFPGQTDQWSTPAELFTMHKRCNRAFEAWYRQERGRMYWAPLTTLPLQLSANLPGSRMVRRTA